MFKRPDIDYRIDKLTKYEKMFLAEKVPLSDIAPEPWEFYKSRIDSKIIEFSGYVGKYEAFYKTLTKILNKMEAK